MKNILMILGLLVVSGCATSPVRVPDEWKYSGKDEVTVLAAIGVSVSGKYPSMLPYHNFKIEGEGKSEALIFKADYDPGFLNSVTDYETKDAKFGIVKVVLKPGEYRITDISSSTPSPHMSIDISAKNKFSIPLKFEAGKNYFLGSFVAHNFSEKGFLGNNIVAGAFWVVDKNTRPDAALIIKKYPELKNVLFETYPGEISEAPFFFTSEQAAAALFQ